MDTEEEIFTRYKHQRQKELLTLIPTLTEQELIKKTKTETMIVHFYLEKFTTCKIMNKELEKIVLDFPTINFYKIDAQNCPVVCDKLGVKILPFLGFFKDGFFVDQVVGFEGCENGFKSGCVKKFVCESNLFKDI